MSAPAPYTFDRSFGYVSLRIEGKGAAAAEKEIDLFDFYSRLFEVGHGFGKEGRHREAAEARRLFLKQEGFGDVSSAEANAVLSRLHTEVENLQKKDPSPATPATPDSTGSPPGPTGHTESPPGSSNGA